MPMSNEVITHKHELRLSQSRISISNSRTKYSDSCTVRDAVAKGNKMVVNGELAYNTLYANEARADCRAIGRV